MKALKRYNFRPSLFPILVEALHPDTRVVVWSKNLPLPRDAAVLRIPPLAKQLGHPVVIRMSFADGDVQESDKLIEKKVIIQ